MSLKLRKVLFVDRFCDECAAMCGSVPVTDEKHWAAEVKKPRKDVCETCKMRAETPKKYRCFECREQLVHQVGELCSECLKDFATTTGQDDLDPDRKKTKLGVVSTEDVYARKKSKSAIRYQVVRFIGGDLIVRATHAKSGGARIGYQDFLRRFRQVSTMEPKKVAARKPCISCINGAAVAGLAGLCWQCHRDQQLEEQG